MNVGDPLFNVADLSLIWVELEVFEPDLPYLKVGQELMILSPALPGQPLQGRVKLIYPFLDQKTRTVKVRVELPNPGLKLKPEMYVRGQIKVPLGSSLTVASESVMDTGKRQVVWVEAAIALIGLEKKLSVRGTIQNDQFFRSRSLFELSTDARKA